MKKLLLVICAALTLAACKNNDDQIKSLAKKYVTEEVLPLYKNAEILTSNSDRTGVTMEAVIEDTITSFSKKDAHSRQILTAKSENNCRERGYLEYLEHQAVFEAELKEAAEDALQNGKTLNFDAQREALTKKADLQVRSSKAELATIGARAQAYSGMADDFYEVRIGIKYDNFGGPCTDIVTVVISKDLKVLNSPTDKNWLKDMP